MYMSLIRLKVKACIDSEGKVRSTGTCLFVNVLNNNNNQADQHTALWQTLSGLSLLFTGPRESDADPMTESRWTPSSLSLPSLQLLACSSLRSSHSLHSLALYFTWPGVIGPRGTEAFCRFKWHLCFN